jgi:hypothetical protein
MLVGKQKKLDKNKDGKLSDIDFKMLRSGKWKYIMTDFITNLYLMKFV